MPRRLPILVASLALLVVFLWSSRSQEASSRAISDASSNRVAETLQRLVEGNVNGLTAPVQASSDLIALAEHRAESMRSLIVSDPTRALEEAISWSAYRKLPAALKPHFEKPFNAIAHLHALPVCDSNGRDDVPEIIFELELDGASYSAFPTGAALNMGSKENTPLAGITLKGLAAIRGLPIEPLSATDAKTLSNLPLLDSDQTHCFATGIPVGEQACAALIGGRRALFADVAAATAFGEKLGEFNAAPGPHSGARVIFELADGAPGEGFDWDAAGEIVQDAADTWTETVKKVLFIRVHFSDLPGEAVSQATLAASLTTTSDNIRDQSYGKTWLDADVSANSLLMPEPTTGYLPSKTSDLHTDAKNAYETANGAGSLAGYDIIGVHFADFDLRSSGGTDFSGLAGGSRQWLQGTTSTNVVIHEFGHNYGIGHASFWDTNDGSVVGAGASSEYGDPFDIMGGGPDPEGHFHMQAKSKLNWIESTQWVDADTEGSGTYRIYRIDDADTTGAYRGIRALKAPAPNEYYWLGHRAGIPDNDYLANGAYLVWQRPNYTRSWLLDTTPGSSEDKTDAALAVGTTYSDTDADVHFTPLATGGSGADSWIDVNVQLGSFPGNASPTVAISGPSTADARSPVTFTAAASDADSDPLAYSWDFGDTAVSPNTSSVSKSWVTGGTYSITLTVSDMKGGTASDTITVTVNDALDTWTARTSGVTADLYDIATDGTTLIAVGSSSGTHLTSTDGVTWASATIDLNLYLRSILHDGSQFVAAGYDYISGAWTGVIYTSPDGGAWTLQHASGERLRDVAFSAGVYIATGDVGTVWRSTDSLSWSQIATGISQILEGVSYGDGKFVAVGAGSPTNSGGPVAVLTSNDGLSWTDTSAGAGTVSWQGFYDVEYCNDRFLASGWYSKIRHSTDAGATFSTNQTGTQQVPAFAYGNGVYLAAGIDKNNTDADINLISTDGESWTSLTTTDQERRNAALFFNNTFITVGNSGSIWQSDPFTAPPVAGFASWLASYFPAGSPATADPDGDGISSAAEYATGTAPDDTLAAALPVAAISGDYLTLTVTKNPAATDVTFSVEFSTDLDSWSTVGTTVVSESATELVVRTTEIADPSSFLRAVYVIAE